MKHEGETLGSNNYAKAISAASPSAPVGPVVGAVQHTYSLASDLLRTINSLEEVLKPILCATPVSESSGNKSGYSCDLEERIGTTNACIDRAISLIIDLRNRVQL